MKNSQAGTGIKITRPLAMHLLGLAQTSPEQEVCGLVAQCNGKPSRAYPINNIAKNPAREFLMDEKEQIAAFKTMRENNETLFAIYHSHPDSPPVPSKTDIRNIAYPDAYTLIISLNTKGVLEMRAFLIQNDNVSPVELTV